MAGHEQSCLANTRREVLAAGAVVLAAVLVEGCDALSTAPDGDDAPAGSPKSNPREAPSLAEQVGRNDLPPVEERLPGHPPVVEPVQRTGVYGGTWRLGLDNPDRILGYDNLVRWDLDWEQVIPNLAADVQSSDDGIEYTFRLVRGVKWSDGMPFTADDIVFAYEDVFLNEELFPQGVPTMMRDGEGEPATLEKVDDYTIVFKFSAGNGLFLENLAGPYLVDTLVSSPRHYLKGFHKSYNAEVQALVDDEGVEDWVTLFSGKRDWRENPEIPTIFAWRITTPFGAAEHAVAERNPYYWKVDPDGSQLPYIDQLRFQPNLDPEALLLTAFNGEVDFTYRDINSIRNKPVFSRDREKGQFHFVDVFLTEANVAIFALNLTHPNPVKRGIFNNRDFRIGLSHAINRETIRDVVYQQQGEPWQEAPLRESQFYDEEMATQYIEYDRGKANDYLDRAGYGQRDDAGIRLGPDGQPISITIECIATFHPEWPDVADLVKDNWREVGIKAAVRTVDSSLFGERLQANEPDATIWTDAGGLYYDIFIDPRWYFPFLPSGSNFAVPWAQWYVSGGQSGHEPPDTAKQQLKMYDQIVTTRDRNEQERLMRQIIKIAKEEFYAIGTINLSRAEYAVVTNRFHNVPTKLLANYRFANPGPYQPEQFFIE